MDGTANSNTYFAGWKNGTSQQCWTTAPFTLTPNQWQLVAVVYNQDTAATEITRTVYVNGTAVSTCTGAGPIATNSVPLQFGDWTPQPFGTREWDGLLDEIEVFNRLQSAAVEEFGEMIVPHTGNDYQCGARGGHPRNNRQAAEGELYILDLGPAAIEGVEVGILDKLGRLVGECDQRRLQLASR